MKVNYQIKKVIYFPTVYHLLTWNIMIYKLLGSNRSVWLYSLSILFYLYSISYGIYVWRIEPKLETHCILGSIQRSDTIWQSKNVLGDARKSLTIFESFLIRTFPDDRITFVRFSEVRRNMSRQLLLGLKHCISNMYICFLFVIL